MPHAVQCIDCKRLSASSPCPLCKRRRNQARAATSFYQSPEWKRLKAEARRVLGDECAICGSTDRPTVHHKQGRSEGGMDVQSNFAILCGADHSQYEADKRAGKDTELRRKVEAL